MIAAITAWTRVVGQRLVVTAQPNNFYDPAQIGAVPLGQGWARLKARARTDQCPADAPNVLQYANRDVAEGIDINRYIRWAGECDKT